jgi:xylulokinase
VKSCIVSVRNWRPIFNLMKMRINRPGGILFPFPSLHVRPDRGTLVRGFLESIGYALRGNIEQLTAITNRQPQALTLSGGMSRSTALTRIIADITGVPVLVAHEPESAALGCAILIASDHGHGGLAAATRAMARQTRIEPDPEQHARYTEPYARWRALYAQLEETEL